MFAGDSNASFFVTLFSDTEQRCCTVVAQYFLYITLYYFIYCDYDLPYDIRACDFVSVFKRKLKTRLFNIAYPT